MLNIYLSQVEFVLRRIKCFIFILLFILYLFYCPDLKAQNYPISAALSVQPPLSNSLLQFQSEPEKITVQLLNKDFATPLVEAYLKLKIEGVGITIATRELYKPANPVVLVAGVSQFLHGNDFGQLWQSENLVFSGLNSSDFVRKGSSLPEGTYRISFTVYDFANGRQISNEGSTTVSLFKHAPPFINVPANGAIIPIQNPQNIIIQFTPRHTFSPALLGKVRYKIKVVEVLPFNRNPNDAILSTSVNFFETIIDNTSLIIGPSDPTLVEGRKYAIQVQAIDVDGHDVFQNDGNSEVVYFIYGSICPTPTNLNVLTVQSTEVELSWDSSSKYRAYNIWYRQIPFGNERTELVFNKAIILHGLKPGSAYEIQISGVCTESESERSTFLKIRTDTAQSDFEKWVKKCGKPMPKVDLSNRNPLVLLQAGDKVKAFDFEVIVLAVSGKEGGYTGSGWVQLPYTGKMPIPCTFENVFINTDHRLVEGKIKILQKQLVLSNQTATELAALWMRNLGMNWNRWKDEKTNTKIDKIIIDSEGDIILTTSAGESKLKGKNNTIITDPTGKKYFISSGGKISASEGILEESIVKDLKAGEGMPASIRSGMPRVHFSADLHNGYDAYEIKSLTGGENYEKLESSDTDYYVGWKLTAAGEHDSVTAWLNPGKLVNISPDSIRFLRSDGTRLPCKITGQGKWTVYFYGRLNLLADAIWAVGYHTFNGKSKKVEREILGKLNLIQTDVRNITVKIIPVNGIAAGYDADKSAAELLAIYKPYNVQTQFRVMPALHVNAYNENKEKIEVNGDYLSTSYNQSLNRFISVFENKFPHVAQYQGTDTAWMFMLGNSAGDEKGFMPLNRNYGFIFSGNSPPTVHTLAHEIGHGLLLLSHPFGKDALNSGRSQNLMDYAPPFGLLNFEQWKLIFDGNKLKNQLKLAVQNSAKGKFGVRTLVVPKSYRNKDGISYNCLTPAGQIIHLSGLETEVYWNDGILDNYYPGTLKSFTLGSKKYEFFSYPDGDAYYAGNEKYVENTDPREPHFVSLLPNRNGRVELLHFSTINVENYDGKTSQKSLNNFPLRIFTDACKLTHEDDIKEYEFNTETHNIEAIAFNDAGENSIYDRLVYELKEVVKRHHHKPDYPEVLQLIGSFSQYPVELKKMFSNEFEAWVAADKSTWSSEYDLKARDNVKVLKKWYEGNPEFYTDFKLEFDAFARKKQEEAAELLRRLKIDDYKKPGYKTKIEKAVAIVAGKTLENLITADQRAFALSILEQGRVNEYTELAMLRLVYNTGEQWIDEFLQSGLLGKNQLNYQSYLLSDLIDAIDDETLFVGEDNYKRFVLILSELVSRSEYYSQTFEAELLNKDNRRLLQFEDQEFADKMLAIARQATLFNYNFKIETAREIDADLEQTDNGLSLKVKLKMVIAGYMDVTVEERAYSPFDLLYITNNSSLPIVADLAAPGSELVMPAIALYWMDSKGKQEFAKDVVNTSLDALSIVTGTVAFRAFSSLTAMRKAMALSDAVSGAAGLASTVTKNKEEYKSLNTVFNLTQLISGGAGIFDLAQSARTQFQLAKAYQKLADVEAITSKNAAEFITELYNHAEDFLKLPRTEERRVSILIILETIKVDAQSAANAQFIEAIQRTEKALKLDNVKSELVFLNSLKGLNDNLLKIPNLLGKLESSTLDVGAIQKLKKGLAGEDKYIMDVLTGTPQSPLDFFLETGDEMYEMFLSNNTYLKYDASTHRILAVNSATGEFYGFAHCNNVVLSSGQTRLNDVQKLMAGTADKFIDYLGLRNWRQVVIPWSNEVVELSEFSVTTFIGRMGDIKKIKDVLGDFKSIKMGEIKGGINILNVPDAVWETAKGREWMIKHNLPWIRRAIGRGDNIYISTNPLDLSNLLYSDVENFVPSITAYEIREIIAFGKKPINVSATQWEKIKEEIILIDKKGKFEKY